MNGVPARLRFLFNIIKWKISIHKIPIEIPAGQGVFL